MGKSLILSRRLTLLISNYTKSKKVSSPMDGSLISIKKLSVPDVTVPDMTICPLEITLLIQAVSYEISKS